MSTRFARAFVALCALTLGVYATPGQALAQRGPAMGGKPSRPTLAPATLDSTLENGTVLVTVVAGKLDKPLANIDVTVQSAGRKVVRSDASGRATFIGLAMGEYVVTASAGAAPLQSEPFALPEAGGVSIVLSSIPMDSGRGGRPSSRMMSGRSRPEESDPSGRLTVRAVSGELTPSQFGGLVAEIPAGAIIHLVEMHADGKMTLRSEEVKEEEEGRVVFDKLARDNSIAYYVMTTFERSGGTDRLMTEALEMPPQFGSRMMFAGAPENSANPGIDDLGRLSGTGNAMPGPGLVEVLIHADKTQSSLIRGTSEVELLQIGNDADVLRAPALAAQPSSASVMGQAGRTRTISDTLAGQVSFYAARPSTKSDIADVEIRFENAAPVPDRSATAPVAIKTNAAGLAFATDLVVGNQYVAVATLHGVEARTEPFSPLKDEALSFAFAYDWKEGTGRQARFDNVVHGQNTVYIAKVFSEGRSFYSVPFQLTKERGASVGIYMYPELLFSLQGGAELDDAKMWFQSRITIANPGIMPFRPSPKGMYIPLPKGFVGASVADEMTSRVGVESGKGFLWRGAVPPGQRDFIASYALPVQDGAISFDMDLPYGVRSGRVALEDLKGVELRTQPGAKVVSKTQPSGQTFLVMSDINIEANQRLVFALRGLPQVSRWQGNFRLIAGVVALLLVFWALYTIFLGPRGTEKADPILDRLEGNREQLMSQLVKLETEHRHKRGASSGGDDSELSYKNLWDKLNTKLTAIYREIDEHTASSRTHN